MLWSIRYRLLCWLLRLLVRCDPARGRTTRESTQSRPGTETQVSGLSSSAAGRRIGPSYPLSGDTGSNPLISRSKGHLWESGVPVSGITATDWPYFDVFRAVALPPFRPAAFFCAVVPPCFELPPEPDFLPPRLEAPGELAIRAARSLDIPLSLRASYCRSFLTLGRLLGITSSSPITSTLPNAIAIPFARSSGASYRS